MPKKKKKVEYRCIYCKKKVDQGKGHIQYPNGLAHWGCYRDENGRHPFNKKYWKT